MSKCFWCAFCEETKMVSIMHKTRSAMKGAIISKVGRWTCLKKQLDMAV